MRGLCDFFLQSLHKDDKPANIADYGNPTLDECWSIHNHTYEANLEFSMILSLDQSIYVKLIDDLSNYYSVGIDQYPQTPPTCMTPSSTGRTAPPATAYAHPPELWSSFRILTAVRPAAKCMPMMARGIQGTLARSSASNSKSLVIMPTSTLMGTISARCMEMLAPNKHPTMTWTDSFLP